MKNFSLKETATEAKQRVTARIFALQDRLELVTFGEILSACHYAAIDAAIAGNEE